MILLIDASRANNEQKTGVEWYSYFVIQELKKIVPAETRVILYSREPLKGALAELPSNWQEKPLKWPPRRLWTQVRLSWEVFKEKRRISASDSAGGGKERLVLFVPAHVLPLVCPKIVVTTIHDLGGLRFPAGYSWFERRYARFSNRRAAKNALIFAPSEFVRREIIRLLKAEPAKVRTISNGYDRENFRLIPDEAKINEILAKHKIKRPYFLSISRLEEKKNTAGIVEAFELFKEQKANPALSGVKGNKEQNSNRQSDGYQLILLGKPGYGFDRVRQAIESSKYKNDIILPGWVETGDVPYLMAGAEAFLFPGFYEGFGIPAIEAMAAGAPVIASNQAALPEVCQDAAILVNPHKPAEIAEAMRQIVSSPQLREKIAARGRERVKNYSWEKTAGEVWEALRFAGNMIY